MSSASDMPQIMTLCGIQPEQTDIDFSTRGLDAEDAKLLVFDLSKNLTAKTVKYAASPTLLCQCPLTRLLSHRLPSCPPIAVSKAMASEPRAPPRSLPSSTRQRLPS